MGFGDIISDGPISNQQERGTICELTISALQIKGILVRHPQCVGLFKLSNDVICNEYPIDNKDQASV